MLPMPSVIVNLDTDSIIYTHRPGQWEPEHGERLGVYKDELEGDRIVEFMAPGPKNYAFRTNSGKTCLKVRGFTLKQQTQATINLDVIKQMLTNAENVPDSVEVDMGTRFVRDKQHWRLHSAPYAKRYRIKYDKRLMLSNYYTLPWGFKWPVCIFIRLFVPFVVVFMFYRVCNSLDK